MHITLLAIEFTLGNLGESPYDFSRVALLRRPQVHDHKGVGEASPIHSTAHRAQITPLKA